MNPFIVPYKITQSFGANKKYYSSFGLEGHEGIDIIPVNWRDTGNNGVHCLFDGGVVVSDQDDGRAYGNNVTIYHEKEGLAYKYCHMSENCVQVGQQVNAGDLVGIMGNTGNSRGPHLHMNLYFYDDDGNKLGMDNGFKGCFDPLPLLEGKI